LFFLSFHLQFYKVIILKYDVIHGKLISQYLVIVLNITFLYHTACITLGCDKKQALFHSTRLAGFVKKEVKAYFWPTL